MRVHLLFADEPVFHPAILEDVLRARPGDIVGVGAVAHRRAGTGPLDYLRGQLAFWSAKGFAVNAAAVARSRVRGRSLQSVCAAHGVPYERVADVNAPAHLERLRALDLDVIVSSQGQIFGRELLELPRLGCINRHSALLPAYGGLKPVFWAMLHGEREVGVSVHAMEPEIDAGRVLAQIPVPIEAGAPLYRVYQAVFARSGAAIARALAVLEGAAPAPSPDGLAPSYFGEPRPADVRRFRGLGLRMA